MSKTIMMKRYEITLTGVTPLLMHQGNIAWCERARKWQKDPANKRESVAGDDRSPAWIWLGYCYHAGNVLVIDSDNLMAMLRDAGKKCPAQIGRGSLKAATQSSIQVDQIGWPIEVAGRTVQWPPLAALADERDFGVHEQAAFASGFELFVKRARVGTAKHIRVRPRFDNWTARGTITVLDSTLTKNVLQTLFDQGGRMVGLGDWRPGSPASGRYGMFTAEIKEA
jgi:hypothetical protein